MTPLSAGRLLESSHVSPCVISRVQRTVHLRTTSENERTKERGFSDAVVSNLSTTTWWFTNVSAHMAPLVAVWGGEKKRFSARQPVQSICQVAGANLRPLERL